MVIRGEIECPPNFLVLHADPGMEASASYDMVEYMKRAAKTVGIDVVTVPGPNLYDDVLTLRDRGTVRLDNAAWFTQRPSGSRGRLRQKCTRYYKVRPMDRWLRQWIEDTHGISRRASRLGEGVVIKWIGFGADEQRRVKPSPRKYIKFDFPLIRLGMTREDVSAYYRRIQKPEPPRSVCNGCFAHSLADLRAMHDARPNDYEQACKVDDAVRNLEQVGVEDPVFVSDTLIPLRRLPTVGWDVKRERAYTPRCDSGYCFT